jgi:hypothetical protein
MDKSQAIQYLAQIAQDFIKSLPPSSQGPVTQAARAAIDVLTKEDAK